MSTATRGLLTLKGSVFQDRSMKIQETYSDAKFQTFVVVVEKDSADDNPDMIRAKLPVQLGDCNPFDAHSICTAMVISVVEDLWVWWRRWQIRCEYDVGRELAKATE